MRIATSKSSRDEVQTIVLTDDEDSAMDEPDAVDQQPPSMLDLAFIIDCTASMQAYINAVKDVSTLFLTSFN